MDSVRLVTYDPRGNESSRRNVSGLDAIVAIHEAVRMGYQSGEDFHVIEAEGQPLRLFWNGLANDSRIELREDGRPMTKSGQTVLELIHARLFR